VASGQAPPAPAWGPLRHPVFRALWIASVAANVGTWMQNVGAAWLMTSITPSPTLVALVQTATSLPFLVAALPAGALADIVDRRKLLMAAQGWMFLVALVLAVLTWIGAMTPALLLVLTFALGLGLAVNLPTWQSIQPDLVPRSELPQAIALGGVNINLSRAIGPAIGGFVIAATGPAATFLINAATFLFALFVFSRWQGSPLDAELTERLPGAVRAGLRYVRNEPALRAVLVRAGLFMVGGSAIMALLPLVARQELGLGSEGYGLLLGCFGAGAVTGAALLPRFKQMASSNRLVGAASVVLAATTAALALVPNPFAVGIALLVGGVAWLSTMANLNTTAQMVLPAWVRARGLSVYVLVFQGCIAAGSAGWGLPLAACGGRWAGPIALAALAGAGSRARGRPRGGSGLGDGRVPCGSGTLGEVRAGDAALRTHPAARRRLPLGGVPRHFGSDALPGDFPGGVVGRTPEAARARDDGRPGNRRPRPLLQRRRSTAGSYALGVSARRLGAASMRLQLGV
jgi:MFS family permease